MLEGHVLATMANKGLGISESACIVCIPCIYMYTNIHHNNNIFIVQLHCVSIVNKLFIGRVKRTIMLMDYPELLCDCCQPSAWLSKRGVECNGLSSNIIVICAS